MCDHAACEVRDERGATSCIESLQGVPVVRDDGVGGKVTAVTANGDGSPIAVVRFDDGAQVAVSPQMLSPDENGIYRLELAASRLAPVDDLVIPVVAEEILIGTEQVTRGVVRVHKHVVTEEKTVDAPVSAEEVVVERLPINQLVEGDAPQVREEDGIVIIPVLEEVLVVEKRLLLREEVRLSKRMTRSNVPQTVVLRHEVVDIERSEADESSDPHCDRLKGEHQMRTVIGLFDDRIEAMNAYSALEADGFSGSDLDILTNDDRDDEPKLERIRQYVPEPDSSIYLEGVRMGGTLLTVKADGDRMQRAAEIMSGYNMVNIQDRAHDWRATNADLPEMTTTGNNSNVLDVIEEDLEIGKETVERGRMRVYSVVTEQPVEENVSLREETIRVQRRPVDRTVPADPTPLPGEVDRGGRTRRSSARGQGRPRGRGSGRGQGRQRAGRDGT